MRRSTSSPAACASFAVCPSFGWSLADKAIRKQFTFKDFPEAVHFVDRIVPVAEAADAGPHFMALFRSGYGGRLLYVATFWTCSIVPLFGVYAFGPTILGALGLTGSWGNAGSALITSLFAVGTVGKLP